MKKEIIFWSIVSAVSTVIAATCSLANFKYMALAVVLSLVLWLCSYVFERSMAPDPWSESPVPKQKKWIASLIFYAMSISSSPHIDCVYWYALMGAISILVGFMDRKRTQTWQEWFRIFEIAIIFAIVAFLIIFLFQFINFLPA